MWGVFMPSSILLTEDRKRSQGRRYGLAVLACGVVAVGLLPFRTHLDLPNTVMFFLLSVVVVAVTGGRGRRCWPRCWGWRCSTSCSCHRVSPSRSAMRRIC